MRTKADLPVKTCATCGRPFAWRRKWARDWENLRYCSKACSGKRRPGSSAAGPDRALVSDRKLA
ncbi:DUF2256 domain-containing protein [Maritimibacter sp. DP1N21-5]|uniref:DUF2256 domain-containing protein n=1 Tax=Maritimibacter sp. DP1N21-5 TaxID=2836867 RepID=UPI001C45D4D7|nr:DUF2256 domain-containing protein [Maritimibacter sp. DP1N21-5]MBV7409401.1 DUF2256 domain-containing protein [Maritimibacter sp. DP1N21-5]